MQLDPLGYMLFGAYHLSVTNDGLECDGWLPIVASNRESVPALDDVGRLKQVLDYSLLRVFEGLGVAINKGRGAQNRNGRPQQQQQGQQRIQQQQTPHEVGRGRQFDKDDEDEAEADEEVVDFNDPTLSEKEVKDLDRLTSNVVQLLNNYHGSLGPVGSVPSSRPQTPSMHQGGPSGFGGGGAFARSQGGTPYSSRPPSAMGGGYNGGPPQQQQGGYRGGGAGGAGGGFAGGAGGAGRAGGGSWR